MDKGTSTWGQFKTALFAALPICLGYVPLGVACGMLSAKAGLLPVQVFLLSMLLYAGGAQFMTASLSISGVPAIAAAASISLMNMRHALYGSALAKYFYHVSPLRILAFGVEITDESFGVNINRFMAGDWSVKKARIVNTSAHLSWIAANMAGVFVGGMLTWPLSIIAFSMTSMFLCLLCMQEHNMRTKCAAFIAALVVAICKMMGLSWIAVLLGSLCGIAGGLLVRDKREDENAVA